MAEYFGGCAAGPSPAESPRTLRLGTRAWDYGSFGIMAVVNRTPDSFFDRGATIGFGAALDAASQAVADGAEIVDIGGVKAGPATRSAPPRRSTGSRAWSRRCASGIRTS